MAERDEVSELVKKWPAYGPEKDAMKAEGNYFTPEELDRMAQDLPDLTIFIPPEPVYDVS